MTIPVDWETGFRTPGRQAVRPLKMQCTNKAIWRILSPLGLARGSQRGEIVRFFAQTKAGQRERVLWPALFHGAPGRIRTVDTRFRRAVLYPLSYGGAQVILP